MSTDKGKGKKREVEEEIIPSTEPHLEFPLYVIKYPVKRTLAGKVIERFEEGYTTEKKDRDWCAYFGWETVSATECTTKSNRRVCMRTVHDVFAQLRPSPDTPSIYELPKLWMNAKGEVDRDFKRDDNVTSLGLGVALYTRITGEITLNAKKGVQWKSDHPRLLENKAAELAKQLEDVESQLTVDMIRNGLTLEEDVRKQMDERASTQPSEEE